MKVASKKERKLLTAMLDELNNEHDVWQDNASLEEIENTHTGDEVSPRFELEFHAEEELEEWGSSVGFYDLVNEEGEEASPAEIAIRMMDIRYFSGYHRTSTGI